MRNKVIVFDLDGTLVNSCGTFLDVLNESLRPFNIQVDDRYIESIRHRNPNKIFDGLLEGDLLIKAYENLERIGYRISNEVKSFPEVQNLLESLAAVNNKLAVWTGRDLESAKIILKNNKIESYFQTIVSGTCVTRNKPNPEGLLKIIANFGVTADDLVVVGDHFHDIEGAREIGATSVLANWHYHDPRNLHHVPHFEFESIIDFQNWLLA